MDKGGMGLIAGALAMCIMPGRDPGGIYRQHPDRREAHSWAASSGRCWGSGPDGVQYWEPAAGDRRGGAAVVSVPLDKEI